MQKYKTTFKQIKENNLKIIGIGYCAAQYLLYFSNPTASWDDKKSQIENLILDFIKEV